MMTDVVDVAVVVVVAVGVVGGTGRERDELRAEDDESL